MIITGNSDTINTHGLQLPELVILDRDGVINYDSDDYVKTADEWIPLPGSIDAIKLLIEAGIKIGIATNQSGIARGFFDEATLHQMHYKLQQLLAEQNVHLEPQAIQYCPHGPNDNCDCRKPKSAMVRQLLDHFKIEPTKTWVVGDSIRDLEAGMAEGCQVVLVLTGKGKRSFPKLDQINANVFVFEDLLGFAKALASAQPDSD